ncbi:hypothetical protein D4R86_04245 [bacterium]|nr:MAG: hypothetical protein D4R86_04245 [bacterium]
MKTISKEQLLKFGMKENTGEESVVFPMSKVIGKSDSKDYGNMIIALTTLRNESELCLYMPDGSILYLKPQDIDELIIFESCIESWEEYD